MSADRDRAVLDAIEVKSRVPLERDRNGHRILHHNAGGYARGCRCLVCTKAHTRDGTSRVKTHGVSGYNRGCRCDVCKTAKSEYMSAQRGLPPRDETAEAVEAERKQRNVIRALGRAAEDGGKITLAGVAQAAGVDRTYIYQHPDLRAKIELAEQERQGDGGNERTLKVTFNISPNVAALIRKAQGGEGGTASQFAWDAVIAELADRLDVDPWVIDPVKRQARRRPNRNKRTNAAKENNQ